MFERRQLLPHGAMPEKADILAKAEQPDWVQRIQESESEHFSQINSNYHTGFIATGYDPAKPVAVFIADWAEVPHHAWKGVIDYISQTHCCFLITQYGHGIIIHSQGGIDQKQTDADGYDALLELSKVENQTHVDAHIKACLQNLERVALVFAAGIAAKQVAHHRLDADLSPTGIATAKIILVSPYLAQDLDSWLLLKLRSVVRLANFPAACLPENPCCNVGCVDALIGLYSWGMKGAVFSTQVSHRNGGVFYYDSNGGVAMKKVPLDVLAREDDRLQVPVSEATTRESTVVVICNRADPYMSGSHQALSQRLATNFPGCQIEPFEIKIKGTHAITHLLGTTENQALLRAVFERSDIPIPQTLSQVESDPSGFPPRQVCCTMMKK